MQKDILEEFIDGEYWVQLLGRSAARHDEISLLHLQEETPLESGQNLIGALNSGAGSPYYMVIR